MHINIKEMRQILAIIKEGSLSKAAEKLYTTQPALSRLVYKLETMYGIQIFDKTKLPWSTTFAGQKILEHITKIVDIHSSLEREINKIKSGNKTQFILGLMSFEETTLLPKILPDFYFAYPNCLLKTKTFLAIDIEKAILEDVIDSGIIISPATSNDLEYIPIKNYDLLVVLPLEHELAKNYKPPKNNNDFEIIDLGELANFQFSFLQKGHDLVSRSIKLCKKHGFTPNVIIETEKLESAYSLVKAGYSATFTLNEEYLDPELAYFKVNDPEATQTVAFAYKKNKKLNEHEEFFFQLLKELD